MPRLLFISDTHTQQGQLTMQVIEARPDILVHSGDFCGNGERISEVGDFADWCAMLLRKGYVKHVVVVAGNHDQPLDETCRWVQGGRQEAPQMARDRLKRAGVLYLQDEATSVMGLLFYGTPWVNRCGDWAFMIDDPGQDERIFNRVRDGLDVLVTHSPPFGILDEISWPGSKGLRRAIERARPRVHVFGHNHPSYGMLLTTFGVLCINAATCDSENRPKHAAIVLDLEPRPE